MRILSRAIKASINKYDIDAQNYINSVGLTGSNADLINRIIKELKATYNGAGKVNTSSTNYWNSLVDGYIFDRNIQWTGIGLRSLKNNLFTRDTAVINSTNGLVCDGTDLPNATLSYIFSTGFSIISDFYYEDIADLLFDCAIEIGVSTNNQSSKNSIALLANSDSGGDFRITACNNNVTTFQVPSGGSGFKLFWVSLNPSSGNWSIGDKSGSIGNLSFGDGDNDFSPTSLRWGWGVPFSSNTYYRPGSTNEARTKNTIVLNRTTTSTERDEIYNILTITSA